MKTEKSEQWPEINWHQKSLLDKDVDERSETWELSGTDVDGKEYSAIGNFTHDELDYITEIELI